VVVTAKELEIRVSGKGKDDPYRSPEAIQQEVEIHLSELQNVYEAERASDSSLMGIIRLDLTIEPDGKTSAVRSQSAKIASKKLPDVIQGLAREWRFPLASGVVKVSYPLLFLPPGMDAAPIIAWMKNTTPVEDKPKNPERMPVPPKVKEPPAKPQRMAEVQAALGMYRTITATPLRSTPQADAAVVTELQSGIRVRIVGAEGNYLRVWSRQGRPPGYVHRRDVVFVGSE
jgi:hypothetical protein